ncbi:ABC transporter permease [Aurantibacillus circumpalustris]|uniref:ABC transporter permease n=1 Tax=Aurantibacillus circumpalustris TaxID=3036359 RepID=UPI00295A6C7D|nr:ABC transporter permease [Aurantibacillus circumpalustris]
MFKLWTSIQKDVRLLTRDKVGLLLMFAMPIVLAILIAAIQNNTFKLVNDNKVGLLIYNNDTSKISNQFVTAIREAGMFEVSELSKQSNEKELALEMEKQDALVSIVIPENFSFKVEKKSKVLSALVFNDLGLGTDTLNKSAGPVDSVAIYFNPVLQESFRQSIGGAVRASLQLIENKQLIKNLYALVDENKLPSKLEDDILKSQIPIQELTAARNGSKIIPNATQHNIPAWTVFAMFFIVISLGSNIVKEKLNGSFVRLKTLPTNYLISLLSKQITYLSVTLLQVAVIFTLGIYLFPAMGLPKLNLPSDLFALFVVSFICGWCAVSYAICIGVFANTQEQANGFGAVTIVILAAIGGLLVPSFAMPDSFRIPMKLSPLHWCLEAYYGLFLEDGKLKDILMNIIPLLGITFLLQLISLWGLKRKNLI